METGKVLFITDDYLPFPSSNGACVNRIVNAYQNKESIYVLSFSAKEAECKEPNVFYCHCKRKPSSIFNRVFGYCQDSDSVNKLYSQACKIITENNIDTVICVYRPIECILTGLKLKNTYKSLCVIGYFLDNICEWSTSSKLKDKILFINQKRLLHSLNRSFDALAVLKYYQPTFEELLSKTDKLSYVGLPSLQEWQENENIFDENCINIVYTGSFYSNCRRPDEILDFLQGVCTELPQIRIYLYSWGCEESVNAAKEKMGENLVICGRVPSKEAEKAINSADILLNVGNDLPYAVPGKLIEYFSTGKSVINFCYRRNDGAVKDCEKYENIFNVYKDGDNSTEDCVKFILNRHSLPWNVLEKRFYDCLPKYTADIISETRLKSKNV